MHTAIHSQICFDSKHIGPNAGMGALHCVSLAYRPAHVLTALQTRYAMLTHVGRVRARNEDACGADPELGAYVVCDGMGGAAGGEIAARETATAFLAQLHQPQQDTDTAVILQSAILAANRSVYEIACRDPRLRGMGTTLVALQLDPASATAWVAHVGDSRCYRVRKGQLQRLTDDHSIVEEQVRSGEMTEAEARRSHLRNVITRVVGSSPAVHPDVQPFLCEAGDLFLLCSDGLNRDLSDADLLSILERHRSDLNHAAQVLVDAANLLGGGDNITVLLVEVLPVQRSVVADVERNGERMSRMSAILRAKSAPAD